MKRFVLTLVLASVVLGIAVHTRAARLWSEKQLADFGPPVPSYDLAPDGKRIVALMPVDAPEAQTAQSHVIFLQNFCDELRRRVSTGK
jgi:hypothetical protein